MIWNPSPHMRHAWEEANSGTAKAALIIFYAWVWVTIVMAAVSVIAPRIQGGACFIDHTDKVGQVGLTAAIRGMNILIIGLLGYADVGGMHVKNIAYVFVVISIYMMSWIPILPLARELGCTSMTYSEMIVYPGVLAIALILAIVDKRMGGGGTEDERMPLNA